MCVPGLNRDGLSRPREGQPVESQAKKTHIDTTASALDAVLIGLPGVNHHIHENVCELTQKRGDTTAAHYSCR